LGSDKEKVCNTHKSKLSVFQLGTELLEISFKR